MQVEINSWVGVGEWKWDVDETTCSICHNAFQSTCGKCKFPGDECGIAEGECNHLFHIHCIYNWVEEKDNCPLCRKKWELKKSSIVNSGRPENENRENEQYQWII